MSNIINTTAFFLSCPKCKESVPLIKLIPFNSDKPFLQTEITCRCQKNQPFAIPLIQYLSQNNNNKCSSIKNDCEKHKKVNKMHCLTCNENLCKSCRSLHVNHHTIEISDYSKKTEKELPFSSLKSYLSYANKYIQILTENKNKLCQRINNEIIRLSELKMKIDEEFMMFIDINSRLIHYYSIIYQNYLVNKKHFVCIDNLKNNSLFTLNALKIDSNSSIESEAIMWKKYYDSNFFLSFNKYRSFPVCSRILANHTSYVKTVCQLPNQRIASGSGDKTIKIWNRNNGNIVGSLIGHSDCINKVLLLNDGLMLSCSGDYKMIIWDINTLQSVNIISVFTSGIWCINQLENGDIAAGSINREIKIFSYPSFKHQFTLMAHKVSVWSIFPLQGGKLISGDNAGTINVWNIETRSLIKTLTEHQQAVWEVIQIRDGRVLSVSNDSFICVWDINTYKCLKKIKEHTGYIFSIVELRDGSFASGSQDQTIKIWNEITYACIYTLKGHTGCPNTIIQLDDGALVSGSDDQTVRIWE